MPNIIRIAHHVTGHTPEPIDAARVVTGSPPVSYTHLDVYKRQLQYSAPRLPSADGRPRARAVRPVSYTHLDVYKRQVTGQGLHLPDIQPEAVFKLGHRPSG